MKVRVIPMLDDNYGYLVIDPIYQSAVAIDPVKPAEVMRVVLEERVTVKAVLTTHRHWDHAGGNKEMADINPGIEVYGGALDQVEGQTIAVNDQDEFKIDSLTIRALHTPCHTKGHICYLISSDDSQNMAVFTGDTLFVGGCGRFFEGTPEQMMRNLCFTLDGLPDNTQVYCGHEYTVKNLEFAASIEPNNPHVQEKLAWAKQQREANLPTVPSTIGGEKNYNPFMRVGLPEIVDSTGIFDAVANMELLRQAKDKFGTGSSI